MAQASTISSDYSYTKIHQICGSNDGSLSGYQMEFIVHRGDGTDDGRNVYLNGHSKSWPDDIRFTGDDGAPLNYWIESSDADSATVWVKIPLITASGATVRLYYGRSGDAGASDMDGTFIFADHFSGGSLDTKKWTNDGLIVSQDNGRITITGPSSYHYMVSKENFGPGVRVRGAWKTTIRPAGSHDIVSLGDQWSNYDCVEYTEVDGVSSLFSRIADRESHGPTFDYDHTLKTWDILWTPDRASILMDGTEVSAKSDIIPDKVLPLSIGGNRPDIQMDWIAVAKYTANEPEHGAWGEEAATGTSGNGLSTMSVVLIFGGVLALIMILLLVAILGVMILRTLKR